MTFKRLVDWLGLHPMVGDSIVAGVMVLLSIPVLITAVSDDSLLAVPAPRNGLGAALVTAWFLGYSLPLVWRRTRPSLACALLVVPHLVQLAIAPIFLIQNISVLLMEFAIAAYGSRRARALWLAVGIAASLAAAVSWVGDANRKYAPDQDLSTDSVTEFFIVLAISVVASWLLGAFARERLTTMRSLKERAEARAGNQKVIDAVLLIATSLLAVAVIIAVVGVGNTLSLSVLERVQELGLLRALGMTRGQVRSMVAWESVTLAAVATVIGLVLGGVYGIIGCKGILASEAVLVPSIPWARMALIAAVALLAGWLASLVPASRAVKVAPSAALSAE